MRAYSEYVGRIEATGPQGDTVRPAAPQKLGPEASVEELLVGVLADDPEAWRELVDRCTPLLHGLVRRTLGAYGAAPRPADVEDAVADVWKNLLENDRRVVRQCLERDNLPATLHVLARRRTIDLLRRCSDATAADPQAVDAVEAEPPAEPAIDPEALAAALDKLSHRERTLVRLYFLHSRRYREIAEITGIPVNSIGPTLKRAVRRLERLLPCEAIE